MNKILLAIGLLTGITLNAQKNMAEIDKCPFHASMKEPEKTTTPVTNEHWWPNKLNLSVLRQNSDLSDPMGPNFNYKASFSSLDYEALKKDLRALMTDSQDWWPADFGNYVPS